MIVDPAVILAGIERREALAQAATPGPWEDDDIDVSTQANDVVAENPDMGDREHIAANDPQHVLAVLAAAREELADAVAQQKRHVSTAWWCNCCNRLLDCPDAQQAVRTLTRLASLYAVA